MPPPLTLCDPAILQGSKRSVESCESEASKRPAVSPAVPTVPTVPDDSFKQVTKEDVEIAYVEKNRPRDLHAEATFVIGRFIGAEYAYYSTHEIPGRLIDLKKLVFLAKRYCKRISDTRVTNLMTQLDEMLKEETKAEASTAYLHQYLHDRNLPENIDLSGSTSRWKIYEEYFSGYSTALVQYSVFTHALQVYIKDRGIAGCIGNVMFSPTKNDQGRFLMQGIVNCPFYEAARYKGVGRLILDFVGTLSHQANTLVEVSPHIHSPLSWWKAVRRRTFLVVEGRGIEEDEEEE